MSLDLNRPYGTIYGDDQGRAYEQDGVLYTATGDEWQASGKQRSKKQTEAAAADTSVDAEVAAQMGQA